MTTIRDDQSSDLVSRQTSFPDTFSNEEPAQDLDPDNSVENGLVYSPASEGLLLGIGNLGGEIGHGHRDVSGRGGSQLHLGVSPEGVQFRRCHLLGSGEQGGGFLDERGHGREERFIISLVEVNQAILAW